MNGARRRASLIALRRGSDALVSSTFFSISSCIMLRASCTHSSSESTIQLFVLLLNDLFLAVTRLFGCAWGYLVLVQEHYTYLTVDLMERFVLLNTRCISSRLLECYRFFIGNYTRSLWKSDVGKITCFFPLIESKCPPNRLSYRQYESILAPNKKKTSVKWNLEWVNDVYETHKSDIPIRDAIEVGDVLKPYPRVGVPFLRTMTRTI